MRPRGPNLKRVLRAEVFQLLPRVRKEDCEFLAADASDEIGRAQDVLGSERDERAVRRLRRHGRSGG